MDWIFYPHISQKELIDKLINPEEMLAHTLTEEGTANVLWAVLRTREDAAPIIICSLLECSGDGWGYKDMAEAMHPYYYSCPLDYLELAPETCAEWRQAVRRYHATVDSGVPA
jgi:hypothetical protein